jgi:hypothetical protein
MQAKSTASSCRKERSNSRASSSRWKSNAAVLSDPKTSDKTVIRWTIEERIIDRSFKTKQAVDNSNAIPLDNSTSKLNLVVIDKSR